jgi:hypothetical protein
MTQLFRDQLKDAVAQRKLWLFWKRITIDFMRTAPGSHAPSGRRLFATTCAMLLTYGLMRTSSSQTLWNVHVSSSWVASFANEIAHFTLLNALLLLQPFCTYLSLTDTFDWNRYLRGLLAALPVFAIGRIAWILFTMYSSHSLLERFHLLKISYFLQYWTQWLPLYIGLAVAMWISAATDPRPEAEPHSL